MSKAAQKQIYAAYHEQYERGPFVFDGLLDEVIASLAAIRELIPPEYRERAKCSISSVGSYEDSHYAQIAVTYWRPETPDETAEREERTRREAADRMANAQREYERLKAIVEGSSE